MLGDARREGERNERVQVDRLRALQRSRDRSGSEEGRDERGRDRRAGARVGLPCADSSEGGSTRVLLTAADARSLTPLGVGLQVNPHIEWFSFVDQRVDLFEVLIDSLVGPLDMPHLFRPGALEHLAQLRSRAPLLAHSNYGFEFGFKSLDTSPAVRRHVPFVQRIGSPWVADHLFYGDEGTSEVWSCPLQFSRAEVLRVAARAKALQAHYGVPLLHENAAYYFPFPGAEMTEAEFLSSVTELAGTWIHLDLHNVYTNSRNFAGYRCNDFLRTITMDRVIAVHIAGGSYARGTYHDWHDSPVPEPVWEMLESVLRSAPVKAVILEYQGRAHHEDARVLGPADGETIAADLARASWLWDRVYGPRARAGTAAR